MKKIIVSDFDGTVTDVEKEASTFEEAYLSNFAKLFNIPLLELHTGVEITKQSIKLSPGLYGWEDQGKIIVSATADPYLFVQTAATEALKSLSKSSTTTPPASDWDKLLYEAFVTSQNSSGTFFRPFAAEYLSELNQISHLTVVTNSRTDSVLAKITKLLGTDHGISVIGKAQKMKLVQDWLTIPEFIIPTGFPRPIYLRRKFYADVLSNLGQVSAVCGDIWELDLSFPEFQGIQTVLLLTENTPAWERDHYLNHPNGISTSSLEVALHYLISI